MAVMRTVVALGLLVVLSESCSWIPSVDQIDFCSSKYVFEADVTKRIYLSEYDGYEHDIVVREVFNQNDQEDVREFKKIYGHGEMNSCGPSKLKENTTYLIHAYILDGRLQLPHFKYREMKFVDKDDIRRMKELYDCSCEVRLNTEKILYFTDTVTLSPPTVNQCNVPDDYCRRSFYCKRNSEGVCKSGNLGQCY